WDSLVQTVLRDGATAGDARAATRIRRGGKAVRPPGEQIGHRGRPEPGGVGAPEREVSNDRPAPAEFVGEIGAEAAVVEDADGRRRLEVVDQSQAADDRDRHLSIALVHVVVTRGDFSFVAGGQSSDGDRVRNVFAGDDAILVAKRKPYRAFGEELEQFAAGIELSGDHLVEAVLIAGVREV